MRISVLLCGIVLLFVSVGCTEQHLEMNTGLLVPTVAEIETKQMLDNLGTFYDRPYALPVQLVLSTGGLQVSDQVSPSITLPWNFTASKMAALAYQKQWVENWAVAPVTDTDDLRRLSYLYRKAAYHYDPNHPSIVHAATTLPTTLPAVTNIFDPVNQLDYYPVPLQKDAAGNPKPDTPIFGNDVPQLEKYPKWIWFDHPPDDLQKNDPAKEVIDRGVHNGHHIWATDAGLSQFFLLLEGAEMNTLKGSTNGLPNSPKNQVFQTAF